MCGLRFLGAITTTLAVLTAVACSGGSAVMSTPRVMPYLPYSSSVASTETPLVERLAGATRVQTAIAISKRAFPDGAPAVVIATGEDYPDALVGGPLAHAVGGPLLLVVGDTLGADLTEEIARLAPARAYILGGTGAVADAVGTELLALGIEDVVRLAGVDRFATAGAVAEQLLSEGAGSSDTAVVVSGRAWPDAVVAGSLAAVLGCPVVLTDGDTVPEASRDVLESWATAHTTVVGGTGVVPDAAFAQLPDPERVGGLDRYATAALLAERALDLGLAPGTVTLATGAVFPDALAITPLAAGARAPVLLSAADELSSAAAGFIEAHAVETTRAALVGGTGALSSAVESEVRALLGAPGGGSEPEPVAGWPDTADAVVVFSDQIDEGISDAQARFVAERYAGSQKQTRTFARRLRGWAPDFVVIHYRLGLGLGYQSGGNWIAIIEGDEWVREWPESPQDSWFYLYEGERVLQHQWGWYLIDPDDVAWRTWWTGEVERQIAVNEDDGLFIDSYSVPNYMGGGTFTPALPDFDESFEAEWTEKIDRYSAYLTSRDAMRPVIANAGQWVTGRDAVRYELLDGVMIEGIGQWEPGTPFEESDWVLQQERVLSLARAGKIVLAQAYLYDPEDMQSRRMALGSYLLSKGSASYLCLELGSEPEWFPEYDLDLGAAVDALPASIEEFRLASGLYARRFERGVVAVNPSAAAVTADVADIAGAGQWDVATFSGGGVLPADADVSGCQIDRTPVTGVMVGPHDAVVLLAR